MATLVCPPKAFGDTEGTAQLYVKSAVTDGTAFRGNRYAKCFPADRRGTKGRTLIYRVREEADELEDAYDWHSWDVHQAGTSKVTVVPRNATNAPAQWPGP